jgi:Amt family ammonium transporter
MPGPDTADREQESLRARLAQVTQAYEDKLAELHAEKELAQVTLASIGDGVLAAGENGRVKYLNQVAESLTGWPAAEAVGRPLSEVFQLVQEPGGESVDDLTRRCREEGQSLRLTERITLQRRDGRRYAIESTCAPLRDLAGRIIGNVLVFQDVSDKRLMALQLAHQATHDELTGLLNRQAFDQHLQRALEETRRHSVTHVFAFLDLDQFKLINDTCGHQGGDELLRRVAAMLQDGMRANHLAARLGGDEFGVLLPNCSLAEAEALIGTFHRSLQEFRFTWRDKSFPVSSSIGIVPIDRDWKTVTHLLSAADHACYAAKEKGRNRIQVYQEDDATFVRRHGEMSWVMRVQQNLEGDGFSLFSQSLQPLSSRAARGLYFEVLLRMVDADGRVHLPSDFLRAAERYGLMPNIDRWVVRRCLEILAKQPPPFLDVLHACSINLSAVSVGDESFLDFLEEAIANSGIPGAKICFEITETTAIENFAQAGKLFSRLAARGVRFALDDFGTGMSSYGYLKDLPVSYLKIDGKFIKDLVTDPLDRAMVESINQVAHLMGLETVAEGVSSQGVIDHLRELGVDYAQGNWISPPRPLGEAARPRR